MSKRGWLAWWVLGWLARVSQLLPALCPPTHVPTGAAGLGLTYEPDAVTLALPPPAPAPGSGGGGSSSLLATAGSSSGSLLSTDVEDGCSGQAAAPAGRHVLIVGSDGLWEVASNEEAVSIALRWAPRCAHRERSVYVRNRVG